MEHTLRELPSGLRVFVPRREAILQAIKDHAYPAISLTQLQLGLQRVMRCKYVNWTAMKSAVFAMVADGALAITYERGIQRFRAPAWTTAQVQAAWEDGGFDIRRVVSEMQYWHPPEEIKTIVHRWVAEYKRETFLQAGWERLLE